MIKFKHNLHQIDACQKLSQELGFSEFATVDQGRNTAPVFDKNGNLSHVLGDYNGEKNFKVLFYKKNNDDVLLEDIAKDRIPKTKIICETKKLKSKTKHKILFLCDLTRRDNKDLFFTEQNG